MICYLYRSGGSGSPGRALTKRRLPAHSLGLTVRRCGSYRGPQGRPLVGFYSAVARFWFSAYVGLIRGTGAFAAPVCCYTRSESAWGG